MATSPVAEEMTESLLPVPTTTVIQPSQFSPQPFTSNSINTTTQNKHETTRSPTATRNCFILLFLVSMLLFILTVGVYIQYYITEHAKNTAIPSYILFNATIYSMQTFGVSDASSGFQKRRNPDLSLPQYTSLVVSSAGTVYEVSSDELILTRPRYKHLPRVDMNGYTIMPSFTDAHGHLMSYGLGLYEVDLFAAQSAEDVVRMMLQYCHDHGIDVNINPGHFVMAGRWDQSKWQSTEGFYDGMPTKEILNKHFPKLPIVLSRVDKHLVWTNDAAIAMVADKIPETGDIPGGKITRYESGEPTGIFLDYAMDIFTHSTFAEPSHEMAIKAFTSAVKELLQLGITSVHDATTLFSDLQLYLRFAQAGHYMHRVYPEKTRSEDANFIPEHVLFDYCPIRLYTMIDIESVCGPFNYTCPSPLPFSSVDASKPLYVDGQQWVNNIKYKVKPPHITPGFSQIPNIVQTSKQSGRVFGSAGKLMVDGALGSWGAYMLEPYSDNPTVTGLSMYTLEELIDIITKQLSRNIHVCTHAIGDAAVHQVLTAYNESLTHFSESTHTARTTRLRIEHFQLVSDTTPWINIMEAWGIIASMQPIHAVDDRSFAKERLGQDRLDSEGYRWREIANAFDLIPMGTDFPVADPSVIENLYSAITMKKMLVDSTPFLANHTINIEQALFGVTWDAAYASFHENWLGSLEPGKVADFVVLSQDIASSSNVDEIAAKLINTKVLSTFLDGNVMFEHKDVLIKPSSDGKYKHFVFHYEPNRIAVAPEGDEFKLNHFYAIPFPEESYQSSIAKNNNELREIIQLNDTDKLNTVISMVNNYKLAIITAYPDDFFHHSHAQFFDLYDPHTLPSSLLQMNENELDQLITDLSTWYSLQYVLESDRFEHIISSYLQNNKNKTKKYKYDTYSQTSTPKDVLSKHSHYDPNKNENLTVHDAHPILYANHQYENGFRAKIPPCIDHGPSSDYARRVNYNIYKYLSGDQ